MRPNSLALGAFLLLLPTAVEIPTARDTTDGGSETRVTVVGGLGRYGIIDRGCGGEVLATHQHDFVEGGAELEHRFPNGVTLGVRGGVNRDQSETRRTIRDYATNRESLLVLEHVSTNQYINPWLGVERPGFGLGVGRVWSRHPFPTGGGYSTKIDPSFHLRIGRLDRDYFRVGFMESMPLYSGGGYAGFGFGSHVDRNWDMYVGFNPGPPFDGMGLVLGVDHRVRPHLALLARARLGESGGEPQIGVGLGITYVTRPPAPRRGKL